MVLDFSCVEYQMVIEVYYLCSSGGRCLSAEYTDQVGDLAKKYGLKLHIDGARIFHTSVVC